MNMKVEKTGLTVSTPTIDRLLDEHAYARKTGPYNHLDVIGRT